MKKILFTLALILCTGTHAYAETFQWDPSLSTDVAGYRLYVKDLTTSALTKIGSDIPGRTTTTATVAVPEPVGAVQITVVAKAYDLAGNESVASNEATKDGTVFVWRDITPPEPPSLLQVLQQIASAVDRIASALEK